MIDPDRLDWEKMDGLLPAIVQDSASGEVRMLGYMDRAALGSTIRDRLVTFFSRSRGGPWLKGETSGDLLDVVEIHADCDGDAILVVATPRGPTCHKGTSSCFGENRSVGTGFIGSLATILAERATADPAESYTARLLAEGKTRMAQKVGEEGVEVALAAAAGTPAEVTSEVADLIYHLTILLQASGTSWNAVMDELRARHSARSATASS